MPEIYQNSLDYYNNIFQDEIHLYMLRFSENYDYSSRYESHLSEKEKERASKYRFREDALNYILGRGKLRLLLSKYLNIPPHEIIIKYTNFNKPYVDQDQNNINLKFNISHSKDLVVFAFSLDEVGVDIEYSSFFKEMDEVAKNYFSPIEFQYYSASSTYNKLDLFYRIWTLKESFIKAIGEGLSFPLQDFAIVDINSNKPKLMMVNDFRVNKNWKFSSINTMPGYIASLAWHGIINKIVTIAD